MYIRVIGKYGEKYSLYAAVIFSPSAIRKSTITGYLLKRA